MKSFIYSCFIVILSLSFTSFQPPVKFKQQKINERISVGLPANFVKMSQAEVRAKYLSYRAPIAAYKHPEIAVDFLVNDSESRMFYDVDTEVLKKIYKANIMNLYEKIEFTKEEIKEISGKPTIVFEFIGLFKGDGTAGRVEIVRTYNYIQYMIIGSRTFIFTFNTPIEIHQDWKSTAETTMNSIVVKDIKKGEK
jgi:hypothetical protein